MKHSIEYETLFILIVLFVFYVVGDILTTTWLVERHPLGIQGESNPLGILIYTEQGVFGLILAKLIMYLAISVMALITEAHFKHDRRSMMISNFAILGLMAWSIIVVSVNVLLIYSLSIQEGTYESVFLFRVYMVVFAMALGGLILVPNFVPKSLGKAEIALAILVIVGPLIFSPGLYQFLLADNITNFVIYIIANIGIIGTMIFGMNRLYTHFVFTKNDLKND